MKTFSKLKDKWPYLLTIVSVGIILAILYREADLFAPLVYSDGDEVGVFYIIKTIRDHGWYLFNPQVGGITGGEMYDYMYCDSLSFVLVKIISLFVKNVYAIGNVFYFTSFVLVSMTSVYVCRKLQYNNWVSVVVGILFSFSPYMQMRYSHMWLTPYYLLPLACLIAIWIIRGEFSYDTIKSIKNKNYILSMIFSFLLAFTGFYYAFFACVIVAIAIVIRLINTKIKDIKKEVYPIGFLFAIIAGVGTNVIPNLIYWLNNGSNPNSELNVRGIEGAEVYGLKLIQMLLPREGHRVWALNKMNIEYSGVYPLVNENASVALGIIASIGLIVSFIWLFQKKRVDKTYSALNILLLLVGTIGGIGSVFSFVVRTPMRCYNRISLLIMFISLLCVAELLDMLEAKMRKLKVVFVLGLVILTFAGVYDQTIDYIPSEKQQETLASTRKFVGEIEEVLEKDSLVFEMPYVNWPSGGSYRMFAGYLESDTLRWSYGCMQGREEAVWQESVMEKTDEMDKLIEELRKGDYDGVYLDKVVYTRRYGEEEMLRVCDELTETLNQDPLISENEELYFWKLQN